MKKGARTRRSILGAAAETVCLDGWRGFSLGGLARRVGRTKSGVYAHFGSRAALELATLEHLAELFDTHVLAPAKVEPPGRPRLEAVFGRWLDWPVCAGLRGRCPFVLAVVDAQALGRVAGGRLTALIRGFEDTVEALAGAAVRRGHLGAERSARELAHALIALRLAYPWAQRLGGAAQAKSDTLARLAALFA